ncbi:pentapeptide repeat-containing protein [Phormidium yuhuli AB48]|uniref:Pentapeptide repeat-containing protein n=1 Tax=Phormidium yuhuli AB48 TaxID=2940671 RepID=A0ABY5AT26_9CYAN|nr:pentapeptide repeat-containing protein [Phormidium yuhuli]USR91972.1 pentapeptide repeat-containing protein [Phormidium yuhuli AB48]
MYNAKLALNVSFPWAIAPVVALVWSFGNLSPVAAQTAPDLRQLLSTQDCPQCDLRNAGLVHSRLSGANLQGANLVRANLSQSDLMGANLSGANLTGVSLVGANLTGANLRGANLTGADLRGAFLTGADFDGAILTNANLRGAYDVPSTVVTVDELLRWGNDEAQQGNYQGAVSFYTDAIILNNQFPLAYLGRAAAYNRMGETQRAVADAERAAEIYFAAGNQEGYETAKFFASAIVAEEEAFHEARERQRRGDIGGNILNVITGIGSLLLQGILPF